MTLFAVVVWARCTWTLLDWWDKAAHTGQRLLVLILFLSVQLAAGWLAAAWKTA